MLVMTIACPASSVFIKSHEAGERKLVILVDKQSIMFMLGFPIIPETSRDNRDTGHIRTSVLAVTKLQSATAGALLLI